MIVFSTKEKEIKKKEEMGQTDTKKRKGGEKKQGRIYMTGKEANMIIRQATDPPV